MMYLSYLLLLFVGVGNNSYSDELVDDIAGWIKNSNSKEIAEKFSSTVQITILDDENIYSKAQAELVLKSFFTKHKPSNVKLIHKLNSNPNYKFAVVLLTTNQGKFRVSYSLKNTGSDFLITEMRFENTNE